jgi:hypothetical protein
MRISEKLSLISWHTANVLEYARRRRVFEIRVVDPGSRWDWRKIEARRGSIIQPTSFVRLLCVVVARRAELSLYVESLTASDEEQ